MEEVQGQLGGCESPVASETIRGPLGCCWRYSAKTALSSSTSLATIPPTMKMTMTGLSPGWGASMPIRGLLEAPGDDYSPAPTKCP